MYIPELPRLLLIEDDPVLGPLIAELLSGDYEVRIAPDGQQGLHLALTQDWEALVVDRGLPILDGVALIQALRRKGVTTPAIILTALGSTAEKIAGLDAGANDYMSKPFDAGELRARLRAITRSFAATPTLLSFGEWVLDPVSRSLRSSYGERVALTAKESDLLALLAAEPERVFSRQELLTNLAHPDDSHSVIDTYVHYLRKKLSRSVIRTVHGLGYQIGDGS
ncbi:DNA-binding response regulator [Arthrobacter psychrolactophilus]|uniref:DNA-binding response regulator n=1 Tax=Arthrobacter psychrolactophilus TaxID=92442 RepID=A0A2V5IMG6_9MICC|nr:response regulator transcription factor [Arthrobacter psychrolactophilus]PYI37809.1 DNA-binding response regulator [Arthrobacter psychrolactophilus]